MKAPCLEARELGRAEPSCCGAAGIAALLAAALVAGGCAPTAPPAAVRASAPAVLPTGYAVPEMDFRVHDHAGILSAESRGNLQVRLVDLEVETGVPVHVLCVPGAAPLTPRELAPHVMKHNRIGGVLVLLALQERDLHVAVGPQARRRLNEQELQARVEPEARPHLHQENFATALTQALRIVETTVRQP
jgi:uncharacterized membrane protein YgcG